ncbi:MAG: glycosyltransferase family 2 protein [Helicobacter sp.]|uniref:glycosyltransferase family 2 protein n=1 Tax=Helicobacter sp. TaxID=218 RepID=UPI0025C433F9|nr:glycosyltransferase family 2 protein [Helicobacter sp.]MCH5314228.1 glycosyltransferase family 2 protein [Helicobacter sp.]
MRLCIVVPAYNEEAVIAQTYKELSSRLSRLIEEGEISSESFICFVDDGSKDKTWEILQNIGRDSRKNIIALKLSRNCGHQNALLAGLEYVSNKCDYALSIDCDLQDDVSVMSAFVAKAKAGAEVVLGVRKSRQKDSFFKKNSALGFYKFMALMGVQITYNHADYRLLSSRAIQALLSFKERNLFLRGIVPLLGFKSDKVEYDRLERFAGESKYPLLKMLSFAWNGITSFSVMPLRFVSMLGIVFFVLSLAFGLYAVYVKFFTQGVVYGWASTIVVLCFFSGIQLLSLGIIGEYIGKIYTETKARPLYFIEDIMNPREV